MCSLLNTTQYLRVSDIIYEKQSIKKSRREAKYNKSGVNSYCVVFWADMWGGR